MNVRIETGPGTPTQKGEVPISPNYNNVDRTTEQELVKEVFSNPEQKRQPRMSPQEIEFSNKTLQETEAANLKKLEEYERFQEETRRVEEELNRSYVNSRTNGSNSDQKMREALARFKDEQQKIKNPEKEAQMAQDWSQFEQGNAVRLEKKSERLEKRSLPSSTSEKALSARMSAGELSGEAQKQKQEEVEKAWQQKEAHPLLEQQLLRTQEALQEAHKSGDKELVAILEEQEKNLIGAVNTYRENKEFTIIPPASKEKNFSVPDSMIEDVSFVEIPNDKQSNTQKGVIPRPAPQIEALVPTREATREPGERTLEKLHELGIDYNALVQAIPDFGSMSEGQQAYILYKAEQQGIEHIQEKANADFQEKQSKSGFFKKLFKSGSMRREANRNAANAHVGLDAFRGDIENMTRHVKDGGWNIVIEDQGNYSIQYATVPEGVTGKEKALFDNYNRAATMLSDVPYEWGLPTASKQEQKAFQKAQEEFKQYEQKLMEALNQGGETHPDILSDINKLRAEVELNQYFSSYPDVSKKLDEMKNASYTSDLVKKIFHPAAAGVAVTSGVRMLSKSLGGLGGATGASAAIGGIMAYRRKNNEFKADAKAARRGEKTKDTTNSTTLSTRTTEKINSLVSKLQNMSPDDPKYAETQALLMTRLQFTDKQMKEGRVNFGKAKDQLKNKQDLINALAFAHTINFENSEEYKKLQERLGTFVEFGNESKKSARRKERRRAVALGATIGAGTATAAWMIADYFNGEDVSQDIQNALKGGGVEHVPTPVDPGVEGPNPLNPTDFEVSVDASSKGAIATFANLQSEILEKYPDPANAPAHIQEFLAKSPTQLAMEENMYRPGEVNESAKIYKGGKLGFNKLGQLVYTDARTGVDILSGEGKFDGGHFDFKAYQEAKFAPQEFPDQTGGGTANAIESDKLHSGTPWETTKKPWLEGVDENGVKILDTKMYETDGSIKTPEISATETAASAQQETLPEGVERVKLTDKLAVDFEFTENSKGKLQSTFHNVNLDNFNAYHKAYVQGNIASYAAELTNSKDFMLENPTFKNAADVEERLRFLTNNMILRDQVLQEGGLDPKSDEYKVLRKERDGILKTIRNNFDFYAEESLFSRNVFDGNKYPDPNYVMSGSGVSEVVQEQTGEGSWTAEKPETSARDNIFDSEKPASAVETQAPATEANASGERIIQQAPKTEFVDNVKVKMEKDVNGAITGVGVSGEFKNLNGISLENYGFKNDWERILTQDLSQVDEAKGYNKVLQIRQYIAARDAFPKNTVEYQSLDNAVQALVQNMKNKPEFAILFK